MGTVVVGILALYQTYFCPAVRMFPCMLLVTYQGRIDGADISSNLAIRSMVTSMPVDRGRRYRVVADPPTHVDVNMLESSTVRYNP